MKINTVGFIGTGVMGKSMIRHLLKKYNVVVYNRTKERALDLLEEGATWADTPTEVANLADVVLTIVGYPKDVEEVYFGDQGIFKSTKENLVVVDLTTSTPTLAKRIAEEAVAHGKPLMLLYQAGTLELKTELFLQWLVGQRKH